ncbi:hypothetical protein EJ03DRAFT_54710 [Teratosphaeria nubilosa]|uniref:Secreted protein n=1 Tax=Teratosphaeria nubilosa TaxID=161662 RepID=A0A6G1LDS1_9PEZI|nr:hypothetical protein EJ03DRAFT_54710 [Teratosphaeria nubilosa]
MNWIDGLLFGFVCWCGSARGFELAAWINHSLTHYLHPSDKRGGRDNHRLYSLPSCLASPSSSSSSSRNTVVAGGVVIPGSTVVSSDRRLPSRPQNPARPSPPQPHHLALPTPDPGQTQTHRFPSPTTARYTSDPLTSPTDPPSKLWRRRRKSATRNPSLSPTSLLRRISLRWP